MPTHGTLFVFTTVHSEPSPTHYDLWTHRHVIPPPNDKTRGRALRRWLAAAGQYPSDYLITTYQTVEHRNWVEHKIAPPPSSSTLSLAPETVSSRSNTYPTESLHNNNNDTNNNNNNNNNNNYNNNNILNIRACVISCSGRRQDGREGHTARSYGLARETSALGTRRRRQTGRDEEALKLSITVRASPAAAATAAGCSE